MKRFVSIVILGLLLTQGCRTVDLESDMAGGIHEILSDYPAATVGISVRDLEAGFSFDQDAGRVFHAASTMKVPVMIEVFRQAEAGSFSLSDSILVRNEFKSIVDGSPYSMDVGEDSDDDVYGVIGKNATVGWLVERMITVSSNLATNILIDLVNADSVQMTIERLGTKTMHVYRGVEDQKAFDLGLNNTSTSEDLATLLAAIAVGRAVSTESDAAMIDVMEKQQFNSMIPAGLPEGTRVAHKTGSITRIHHDAAIVYPADRGPYVLVILIEGIDDHSRSAELAAKLAGSIHGQMIGSR